jgi:hypothetical protein
MLFATRIAIPLLTRTFSSSSKRDPTTKAKLAIQQGQAKAQASSTAVKAGVAGLKERKTK